MWKWLFNILLITSCTSDSQKSSEAENIRRHHDEYALQVPAPQVATQPLYPWQNEGDFAHITKEHFRCKGNSLNPPTIVMKDGKEQTRFYDCSGSDKHSLPLKDGKEHVYPILLELLNHVQKKTTKRVVVTSGHRCLAHQSFIDPTPKGSSSKHMIAAEVDFYVQGLEDQPQKVVQILLDYYKGQAKEYEKFTRFDKTTDVSTTPWLNKEVFIKIYKSGEGRNFDNAHSFPYIAIQVRYDRQKNEKVLFSPEEAQKLLRK